MLTPENLIKILRIDYNDYSLYWMDRDDICHAANSRLRHKKAFTSENKNGYRHGRINQRTYLAHRVIWAIHYGEWPNGEIDHINGCKTDNRIENLRIASPSENRCNRGKQGNNTSGYKWVYFNKRLSHWYAEIRKDGKKVYLGSCKNPEDAHRLYTNSMEKYHGDFHNSGEKP